MEKPSKLSQRDQSRGLSNDPSLQVSPFSANTYCITAAEIARVIRHLTQGTYREVDAAIDAFFVRDAAFVHPFVRVPRFSFNLPGVGNVNSRMIIHAIYRWYRFLSPETQVTIASSGMKSP
jgi:hypothetical protein